MTGFLHLTGQCVDIATEWNLKTMVCVSNPLCKSVDIATEWNLKEKYGVPVALAATVDIATEWNLKNYWDEQDGIGHRRRYSNRMEFKGKYSAEL